ncbi:uncharacterized protein METZ01_LOCUS377101 [marine metagenome]|uniref:Uncharacterized protein n=1 Tax=marine metagenome TaxID=408172 RepID=A0A382TRR2_9ZZZZ
MNYVLFPVVHVPKKMNVVFVKVMVPFAQIVRECQMAMLRKIAQEYAVAVLLKMNVVYVMAVAYPKVSVTVMEM